MTVWAASQPTRGQLLEKSIFRISGTIIGTVAGVLLVIAMNVHPVLLVVGLPLWVGACTFVGNLQRGLVSYGTVLAGIRRRRLPCLIRPIPAWFSAWQETTW